MGPIILFLFKNIQLLFIYYNINITPCPTSIIDVQSKYYFYIIIIHLFAIWILYYEGCCFYSSVLIFTIIITSEYT
jgi:hypothetical protein